MNKIRFSQALDGYELAATARHLSKNTLIDYHNTYRKLQTFLADDPYLDEIDRTTLQRFFAAQTVSNKTLLNYHIGLSALWTWAVGEQILPVNILHAMERPKPAKRDIIPFTEQEVRAILNASERSKAYQRPGKKTTSHTLPNAARNRAIVLTLIDTGLRASELCNLRILDVDLRARDKIVIVHEGKGMKDRHIPISSRTAQAIWRYLTSRPDARLNDPLFATSLGKCLNRNNLGDLLEVAAERAGVRDCHPHRFRHTFAINFLRNGGDIYTLQAILGHETLEMCLRYLKIAQMDIDNAHRRASPVDNWQL